MSKLYWGNLMHLGYNMWFDEGASYPPGMNPGHSEASSKLRCDRSTWNAMIDKSVENGVNMVVIDLGEGVKYDTHPELAVEGSWTVDELRAELSRLRSLGITPIPKLNFSLTHNKWLGPYKRMATSDLYNKVCTDLISEVCDIFDNPPMFHLGMDEEEAANQINMQFAAYRQFDLWWHDLYILFDACDKKGVRPALWSDYAVNHLDEYLKRMSKDAVQFHWYYWNYWGNVSGHFLNLDDPKFDYSISSYEYYKRVLKCYQAFDKAGFDQIPTGSSWGSDENFENLCEYARCTLNPKHLLGFMQTAWAPTLPDKAEKQFKAIELLGHAKQNYRG